MAIRTITNPQSLYGLDASLRTAIKGLEEIIVDTEKSIEDFIPQMFKEKTFNAKTMTKAVYGGFGLASNWDMTSDKVKAETSYLWDISATQYAWGDSFDITYEQQKFDDLYKLNPQFAQDFSVALATTRQYVASTFWNNAFTASSVCQWYGVEGAAFFSASHNYSPQAYESTGATTWSNLGTGALSLTSILDACNKLYNQRDWMGRPKKIMPKTLWVYPTQIASAREYLGQGMSLKSGEVSNNRNPFQNSFAGIEVKGYPYFSDVDTWILQGDKTNVFCSEMIPMNINTLKPETTAHTVTIEGCFTFASWAESPMGYVGWTG